MQVSLAIRVQQKAVAFIEDLVIQNLAMANKTKHQTCRYLCSCTCNHCLQLILLTDSKHKCHSFVLLYLQPSPAADPVGAQEQGRSCSCHTCKFAFGQCNAHPLALPVKQGQEPASESERPELSLHQQRQPELSLHQRRHNLYTKPCACGCIATAHSLKLEHLLRCGH